MHRLIERLRLLLKFVSVFGARGIPIAWKLYVGRPGKVVSVSVKGHRLLARKRMADVGVFRQAFVERETDFMVYPQGAFVMKRYNEILDRGRKPLVIDCGAHTGFSTIFLASLFPQATILALEPADDNFDLLRRNTAGCETVVALHAAVWDKTTSVKVVNSQAESYAYQTSECEPAEPGALTAFSIPALLERFADAEPLLTKVDVEGSEDVLFRNNPIWMKKMPLLIIELHDWLLPRQKTSAPFLAMAAGLDADFVSRGENIFLFNWRALQEQYNPPEEASD